MRGTDPGTGVQAMFGVGQIAGQVFRDVPSLLLLFFMTNTLGIDPAVAGTAIFVPKFIWGSICDLTVGMLSDRLSHRVQRRSWLLLGALFAPLAMILLFHVPAGTPVQNALYVAAMFSFYMMVFAVISVPYLAIGTALSANVHGRTAVMAWRLVFTAVGILLASSIGPLLLQYWGGGKPAYQQLSIFLSVISSISLVVAYLAASSGPKLQEKSASVSLPALVKAFNVPRFTGLLGPVLLQLVGSGLSYASMLYFLNYNLARTDSYTQLGVIVLIMTAGIILAQPLWLALSRRFGKRAVYIGATAGYGLNFAVWASFTAATPIEYSYLIAASAAVFNSGWALMSFSLLGDVIAADAEESGEERGGFFSAVWVAADKIGFALGGTLLVGGLLSVFGFSSTNAVAGAAQPLSAHLGIAIAYGYAPVLLNLLAIIWFVKAGKEVKNYGIVTR